VKYLINIAFVIIIIRSFVKAQDDIFFVYQCVPTVKIMELSAKVNHHIQLF